MFKVEVSRVFEVDVRLACLDTSTPYLKLPAEIVGMRCYRDVGEEPTWEVRGHLYKRCELDFDGPSGLTRDEIINYLYVDIVDDSWITGGPWVVSTVDRKTNTVSLDHALAPKGRSSK